MDTKILGFLSPAQPLFELWVIRGETQIDHCTTNTSELATMVEAQSKRYNTKKVELVGPNTFTATIKRQLNERLSTSQYKNGDFEIILREV